MAAPGQTSPAPPRGGGGGTVAAVAAPLPARLRRGGAPWRLRAALPGAARFGIRGPASGGGARGEY